MASRAAQADVAPRGRARPRSPGARARPFDVRVLAFALAGSAPGAALSALLLFRSDLRAKDALALALLVIVCALGFAFALRASVDRTFRTIENLVGAVREGDYSFRARHAAGDDPLASAMRELNLLGATLREQRTFAVEASALLDKVMQSIDVAVFAFDADGRVRLVNPAGERLLGRPAARILGADAASLGVAELLEGDAPRTVVAEFPAGRGRWELRRATFRLSGRPHALVVLADLRRALREEEHAAWQRLVRVLGHEINNSLAPIHSIAAQMHDALRKPVRAPDFEEDLASGLAVVARRAEALQRFLGAYAKLARLPRPRFAPVDVAEWTLRTAKLEARMPIAVRPGPSVTIDADPDQLDQLLINLVQNAADAALEVSGPVEIGWSLGAGFLEVRVVDGGPGIADTENLFVPFFTTKPAGTGIGLVLCRQIAEAHGGAVTLEPGPFGRGCVARVRLPAR